MTESPQEEGSRLLIRVFQGMSALAIGAGASRLISFASIPVVTRIYDPSDFGVYSIFSGALVVLAPLMTLRFPIAIPLPVSSRVASRIAFLALLAALAGAILLSFILIIFGREVFSLFGVDELYGYWWLIVLGTVAVATYETGSMLATRERSYRQIAHSQVCQAGVAEIGKILGGVVSLRPHGLLIGHVGGYIVACWVLRRSFIAVFRANCRFMTLKRFARTARTYQSFPIFRAPSQLVLALSMQAPVFFTALLFDTDIVGQLGLAILAISLPFSLFGQSLSRVYYGEIASLGRGQLDQIRRLSFVITTRLVLFTLPLAIFLFLFAEMIFVAVFGQQWRLAGQAAGLLSIYLVFQMASSPLLEVFNVLGGQLTYLKIYLQRLSLVGAAYAFSAVLEFDFLTSLAVYSLILALHYLLVCLRVAIVLRPRK